MDYQDHTQNKIITRYNSCIKAKQAHDYNHFKVLISYQDIQNAYSSLNSFQYILGLLS